MRFGKINNYILFGGGTLLRKLALEIKRRKNGLFVVTSSRHARELSSSFGKETLEEFLSKNSISFTVTDSLNVKQVTEKINSQTVGLSLGAAWIFKADFINLFQGRLLNLHGTCLPRFRGGGGYSWRIMLDDRDGCSLVHLIDPGIDTGGIVKFENYKYPVSCRIPVDYEKHSVEKYMGFLKKFLDELNVQKDFKLIKQDESKSTYWPRLATDIHGFINWSWNSVDVDRFICAFDDPYRGASAFLGDTKVRLKKSSLLKKEGKFHPYQSGLVFRIHNDTVFIASESGALAIREVKDYDGNDMMSNVRVGDRFYTPVEYLENAKQYRAVYLPQGLKNK